MLDPVLVVWGACGVLAAYALATMMRRRQLHLIDLLKKYVDLQSSWARRRERAEAMALENEKKAKQKEQFFQLPGEREAVSQAEASPQRQDAAA